MTIFLTTQYLEEADVLADRVGIIVRGKIVGRGHARRAEAPHRHRRDHRPRRRRARRRPAPPSRRLDGVGSVEVHGDELTISVDEGPPLVSAVAVALERRWRHGDATSPCARPRLDDVFLELTGDRFRADTDDETEGDRRCTRPIRTDENEEPGRDHRDRRAGPDHRGPGPQGRLRGRPHHRRRPGRAAHPARARGDHPRPGRPRLLLHRERRGALRTSPTRSAARASTTRRSSSRWRSCSPSPASAGPPPWSPTSRTATSTG